MRAKVKQIYENGINKIAGEDVGRRKARSIKSHFYGGVLFPLVLVLGGWGIILLNGIQSGVHYVLFFLGVPLIAIVCSVSCVIGIFSSLGCEKYNMSLIPSFISIGVVVPFILGLLGIFFDTIREIFGDFYFSKETLYFYFAYLISSTIVWVIWVWREILLTGEWKLFFKRVGHWLKS